MPTYAYACTKCGREFEIFQSMKDPALSVCPKEVCGQKRWGKGRVKRQLGTGAGLIFKGSGFYITDYRSENYKQAAKKDGSTPSTSTPSTPAPASTPASTGKKSGGDGAKKSKKD